MTPVFWGQGEEKSHVKVSGKSNQGDRRTRRGCGTTE